MPYCCFQHDNQIHSKRQFWQSKVYNTLIFLCFMPPYLTVHIPWCVIIGTYFVAMPSIQYPWMGIFLGPISIFYKVHFAISQLLGLIMIHLFSTMFHSMINYGGVSLTLRQPYGMRYQCWFPLDYQVYVMRYQWWFPLDYQVPSAHLGLHVFVLLEVSMITYS